MNNIRVWNIQAGKPIQLNRSPIALEKDLESWIAHDPSLISPDLLIVGRQLHVEAGFLDLLAIDRLGNYWAIIEVKKGRVSRDTISQALDYASCIQDLSEHDLQKCVEAYLKTQQQNLKQFFKENDLDERIFDPENRNIAIYVVGTGRDANLERVARFLTKRGSQVNVVTFDSYDDGAGNWTLVHHLEQFEEESKPELSSVQSKAKRRTKSDVEKIIDLAHKRGVGEAFEIIYNAATKYGLFPRTFSQSIMYAPQSDKRRFLIYTPLVKKQGEYIFSYSPTAFAEFFPVSTAKALFILGLGGGQLMTVENAQKFAQKLDRLFKTIQANS